MASIKDEDQEKIAQTLFNLKLIHIKFCRQINDLRALRHSIKDAVAWLQATEEDYDKLKTELESLDNIREEYMSSVNEFNAQFGWKQQEETVKVNKTLDDNLNEARSIKVNVEMLMRNVERQLILGLEEHETDDSEKEQEGEDKDSEEKPGSAASSLRDGKNAATVNEDNWCMKMGLKIGCGMFVVIMFYFGLGAVIKLVEDNRSKIDKESKQNV